MASIIFNIFWFGFFCLGIWFKDWSLWVLLIPVAIHAEERKA